MKALLLGLLLAGSVQAKEPVYLAMATLPPLQLEVFGQSELPSGTVTGSTATFSGKVYAQYFTVPVSGLAGFCWRDTNDCITGTTGNVLAFDGSALKYYVNSTVHWQSTQSRGGLDTAFAFRSTTASGNNAFEATVNGARVDFGAGVSDYASSDGSSVTFASQLNAANFTSTGTNNFSGATAIQASAVTSSFYSSGSGQMTWDLNAADATTSTAIPALALKCDQDITTGDLCIGVKDSAGTVVWGVNEQGGLTVGGTAITFPGVAPTITSACTSPTVTHGKATSFQVDVGTSCTGISTIVLALPTATNGWECGGYNKTTATVRLDQTADTTTSATIINYGRTTGLAVDFVDGADLVISCTGR